MGTSEHQPQRVKKRTLRFSDELPKNTNCSHTCAICFEGNYRCSQSDRSLFTQYYAFHPDFTDSYTL